jgi:acyl carrier protein
MTSLATRDVLLQCLADVAPDADVAALAPSDDLREALDLDSMDVFNLVAAIAEATGVDIPDSALARLRTLEEMSAYVDDARAA